MSGLDELFGETNYGRFVPEPLDQGDSAKWFAGALYALSGQTISISDSLVECTKQDTVVDNRLSKAFWRFSPGPDRDMETAFILMAYQKFLWGDSLDNCDSQTKRYFSDQYNKMASYQHTRDEMKANYEANKQVATDEFDSYLSSWSAGDFFNSGMH